MIEHLEQQAPIEANNAPRYTARNSAPETAAALERYVGAGAYRRSEQQRRDESHQQRVQKAMTIRALSRIGQTFESEASGDPFRAGCDLLKNRLIAIREAHEIFALHRADSAVNGITEGLRMFKVITPEQWRWLIALRNSAYELRLAELQK